MLTEKKCSIRFCGWIKCFGNLNLYKLYKLASSVWSLIYTSLLKTISSGSSCSSAISIVLLVDRGTPLHFSSHLPLARMAKHFSFRPCYNALNLLNLLDCS